MSGSGDETVVDEDDTLSGSVEHDGEWVTTRLTDVLDFLSRENDYGFSLMGNPIAYIISTISAFFVAMIFGVGEYIVQFIRAVAWPFEMVIEYVISAIIDLGMLAGPPVIQAIQDVNRWIREAAMEMGVAAPVFVLAAYLVIGAMAYLVLTRILPFGSLLGAARRWI